MHIATIYRWVDAGAMVAVKFSGIMFIPTSEVEIALAAAIGIVIGILVGIAIA